MQMYLRERFELSSSRMLMMAVRAGINFSMHLSQV